ncbi:hypothetical protein, variant [Aphanomyces invadans]|uniref:Serine aminopeptidase S33 domain-containing protein n=1 Tax=Aphanomyces invadans TaxID=157072 RepID=A0A024U1U8_9STRA|nr:hypothetical protein, variant [Aphanomyces invadans]ETV99856.1 hypothetical protein, variant [Aphanomyces invadans]|eukprot:XP_008871632.1 hypothetical protein, variant [Aphanomyces invadans]
MGNSNAKAPSRQSRTAAASVARSASEGCLESPLPSSSMALSSATRTASHPPPSRTNHRREGMVTGGIQRGQEAVEDANRQLSYWYLVRHGYDQLVNLIIRPPRAKYDVEELGPTAFELCGRRFERTDFQVSVQRRGQPLQLQCSHWHPIAADRPAAALPCLIYLHGNSSCRLEAHSILRCVLSTGATVVAMDCIGCGASDGDYITLGYFERDDVHALVEHLRNLDSVSTIGLWGRSMGAVTALLHADRDPSIAGLVVDSAFANLDQLVHEVVEHGRQEGFTIPTLAVKIVLRCIRSSVHKRAQFDLKDVSPIDHVHQSFIPALFVAAHSDTFIRPHHTEALFAKYAGDKNLIKVQGDHNSPRPQYLLDSVGIFLQSVLRMDPAWQLHDPFASALPWCRQAEVRAPRWMES